MPTPDRTDFLHGLARGLSVAGHPALLMPLGVGVSSRGVGASEAVAQAALLAAIVVAFLVCAYSLWRARSGAWQHVDASVPAERLELNRALMGLLLAAGAAVAVSGGPRAVTAGLWACGALVLLALFSRRWLKLSLHMGFATFALCLVWPVPVWRETVEVLVPGLAWSRWYLRRHTLTEIVLGALAGLAVGGLLWAVLARLAVAG